MGEIDRVLKEERGANPPFVSFVAVGALGGFERQKIGQLSANRCLVLNKSFLEPHCIVDTLPVFTEPHCCIVDTLLLLQSLTVSSFMGSRVAWRRLLCDASAVSQNDPRRKRTRQAPHHV